MNHALTNVLRFARKFAWLGALIVLVSGCGRLGDTSFSLGGNGSGYGHKDQCADNICRANIVAGGNLTIKVGPKISVKITQAPTNGTVTVSARGAGTNITYTPNAGFVGIDIFTYDATENGVVTSYSYEVRISQSAPPPGQVPNTVDYVNFVAPLMNTATCTQCHNSKRPISLYLDTYSQPGTITRDRWTNVYFTMSQMFVGGQVSSNHQGLGRKFTFSDLDNMGNWLDAGLPVRAR